MATLIPFQASLDVQSPLMQGLPNADLPLQFVAQFTHRADFRIEETGTGTKTLDLGSLGANGGNGAKFLLISIDYDSSSAALPVRVSLGQGGSTPPTPTPIEVSPGGWICLASPHPTVMGVVDVTLAWSSSFHGYVWVLG